MSSICAVVVTYFANHQQLCLLVRSLSQQNVDVIIINNGGSLSDIDHLQITTIITPESNLGIAAAHNLGIRYAQKHGHQYVLLMDQDSLPEQDMVAALLEEKLRTEKIGIKIAAVGPVTIDSRTGKANMFTSCEGVWLNSISPAATDRPYIECEYVISSGCLIALSVIDHIGTMEESLFIDCVDIEWGFRARACGYKIIGVTRARMTHTIGDHYLELFGRKLTVHTPLRHYYFYRNFYLLLFRRYVSYKWKIHVFIGTLVQAAVFALFIKQRRLHMRMIAKGIYHGLIGRVGKHSS